MQSKPHLNLIVIPLGCGVDLGSKSASFVLQNRVFQKFDFAEFAFSVSPVDSILAPFLVHVGSILRSVRTVRTDGPYGRPVKTTVRVLCWDNCGFGK